jgi:phosphate transport system substrate-binding protein
MRIAIGPVAAALLLAGSGQGLAQMREHVFVVGSSTVYPFATVVAERFGQSSAFKTPKVEQTGTGGGLKLFCAGLGSTTPDIATASRRITRSEVAQCAANGVDRIVELVIGFDGIVIADAKEGPAHDFSLRDLYLGLARQVPDPEGGHDLVANPYRDWAAISPGLEGQAIQVYGPSPVHGTYDALLDLAMEPGCATLPWVAALATTEPARFETVCHAIREDGPYIGVSGNYNLTIEKMRGNPQALGVIGFNYLDQNRDLIQAASIDGIEPTVETIMDGDYELTRELYVYVKQQHVARVPGLQAFAEAFTSDAASGDEGYLSDRGLIPLPAPRRRAMQEAARKMTPLDPAELK